MLVDILFQPLKPETTDLFTRHIDNYLLLTIQKSRHGKMVMMNQYKIKTYRTKLKAGVALSVLMLVVGLFAQATGVGATSTSDLKQQAKSLQSQIEENLAQAETLLVQADTLVNKIATLDNEIVAAQAEIDASQVKIEELSQSIIDTQTEIDRQKELLKTNLVQMYKSSGSTSVELLFSSDSFGTFINNQEYLDRVKDGISASVNTIMVQKQQLEESKLEQQRLKAEQEANKLAIETTRSERATLLEQTKGQETEYRKLVDTLQAQQKEINAQIAAQSSSISYAGTGSYPWADVASGYWNWQDYFGSDPWGMSYRQCVSYTAWKVADSGRYMPTNWTGGKGNATNWVPSAEEDGIPVYREPQAGDVGIYRNGYYGHAVYVDEVYSNGQMKVSQYNFNYDGLYSEMVTAQTRWDLYFIRFP